MTTDYADAAQQLHTYLHTKDMWEKLPIWYQDGLSYLLDASIAAARSPDGEYTSTVDVRGDFGWKPFLVRFKLSEVEIVKMCETEEEHEWTEWRYDYMGGDNRECLKCQKKEHC